MPRGAGLGGRSRGAAAALQAERGQPRYSAGAQGRRPRSLAPRRLRRAPAAPDCTPGHERPLNAAAWGRGRARGVLASRGQLQPRPSGGEGGGGRAGAAGIVAIQCIYALVCLMGLVGNALVIFVTLRSAKMRTAANIYLLNLAVADELFKLSLPFVASSVALRHGPFRAVLCRTMLSMDGLNMFTSVFCLTVLSVDR